MYDQGHTRNVINVFAKSIISKCLLYIKLLVSAGEDNF